MTIHTGCKCFDGTGRNCNAHFEGALHDREPLTVGKVIPISIAPLFNVPRWKRERTGPRIIGLCGHMGSGKDAAAALLSMVDYRRVAFADAVRSEVAECAAECAVPDGIDEDLGAMFGLVSITERMIYAKPTGNAMRRILQWYGMWRRGQDENYWLDATMAKLNNFDRYVVSDVRFPNEVAAIRKRGGVIWRIKRDAPRNGIEGHVSESAVDDIRPDAEISNAGTLIELADELRALLRGRMDLAA